MSLDWTDTAKRLVAHPKWEWREGMLAKPDLDAQKFTPFIVLPQRIGRDGLLSSAPHFPDLKDWATVGIILGMCFELAPTMYIMTRERGDWCVSRFQSNRELRENGNNPYKGYFSKALGQALGELWLELVEVE